MHLPRSLTCAVVSAVCVLPAVAPLASAAPRPIPDSAYGVMWTVQPGANSLSEYAPNAAGTDAPIATIRGAATGLHSPSALAVSKSGNLFVANAGNNSITEYAATATGNAAPLTTIAGPHTGLDAPSSITFAGGSVWVTDPASDLVEAFSAGSNGDVLPAETIAGKKTHLNHPVSVTVGQLIPGESEIASSITVLNAPANGQASITSYFTGRRGNIAPQSEFTGTEKRPLKSPTALVAPSFDVLLVADSARNSVTEYFAIPGVPFVQVLRTIAGPHTGLNAPSALSFDALGHIVVANSGDQTVRVFGTRAHGDSAPLRTLSGVGTRAGSPAAVAVFGAPPGPPTNLKVKVDKTNAKMSWRPPAVTGGGIEGYEALAERVDVSSGGGGGVLVAALRRSSRTAALRTAGSSSEGGIGGIGITKHTTFTKHGLKPGHRYLFLVAAINGFGVGVSRPVAAALVIPPSAPRHVKATTSRHAIAVTWKAPKLDGGQRLRRYDVEYGTCVPGSKGCRFHTRHVPVISGPLAPPRGFSRITGLNPGTHYYVRVAAENKSKVGRASRAVSATTSG